VDVGVGVVVVDVFVDDDVVCVAGGVVDADFSS